jgi:hypothetical protein
MLFVNNTVGGTFNSTNPEVTTYVGGGAVLVVGGGDGARVEVAGTTFLDNQVVISGYADAVARPPAPCGGALCVLLGLANDSLALSVTNASISVSSVLAAGNLVSCSPRGRPLYCQSGVVSNICQRT